MPIVVGSSMAIKPYMPWRIQTQTLLHRRRRPARTMKPTTQATDNSTNPPRDTQQNIPAPPQTIQQQLKMTLESLRKQPPEPKEQQRRNPNSTNDTRLRTITKPSNTTQQHPIHDTHTNLTQQTRISQARPTPPRSNNKQNQAELPTHTTTDILSLIHI